MHKQVRSCPLWDQVSQQLAPAVSGQLFARRSVNGTTRPPFPSFTEERDFWEREERVGDREDYTAANTAIPAKGDISVTLATMKRKHQTPIDTS